MANYVATSTSFKKGHPPATKGVGWKTYTDFPFDEALSLYQSGLSLKAVADKLEVGLWSLWKRFKDKGITVRNNTEKMNSTPVWNTGKKGECPQLSKGGQKSGGWNKGLDISHPSMKKMGEARKKTSHIWGPKVSKALMGHKPTFSTKAKIDPELGHCIRSKWEQKVCSMLKDYEVDYIYEPCGFTLSDGSGYWPDLFLPEYGMYVEIKGWQSPRWMKRLEDFHALYPNTKLLVVGEKEYRELESYGGRL